MPGDTLPSDVMENPLSRTASADSMFESEEVPASAGGLEDDELKKQFSEQRVALEAALKGLKDGSLSEQEAAAVVERLVDGRVDMLRAELTSPTVARTMLGPLIQTIFAHMTEAPTNVREPS